MDNSPEIEPPHSNNSVTDEESAVDCGLPCQERLNLYKAAKEGKWKEAKDMLEKDIRLLHADLTYRKETILHVATQANQAKFVRLLLEYLELERHLQEDQISNYLKSKDMNGNTAFVFAVASGNMEIVNIMEQKSSTLLMETGDNKDLTPLYVAAFHGKSEMACHIYENTTEFAYEESGLELLLFLFVNAGIYGLALKLLENERRPRKLAFLRDEANETVLHILSRNPPGLKQTQQHDLVEYLWNDIFLELSHKEFLENIRGPPHVAFNAVKAGNFKFLERLISTYPYLMWEVDENGRSIIQFAVFIRQPDIFNFTRGIGAIKDIIVQHKDTKGNNLLHMAATLPSKDRLNLVFGAAFQMTHELLWFEAVKKIVPPSFIEMKNENGLTPQDVFTADHEILVDKAQSWTKKTTNCCMVVSTLITTGVFTATFSIPGDVDDKTGRPNYLVEETKWFMIFSIFDAIAMISSSTSIFVFFSILISRHAQFDFQYKSLPMKLIFGLITLLISIISMMISFSSSFIMYFNTKTQSHGSHHNGLKWVPIFICVLAFIPIPIFVYLLCPLWSDIVKLTYLFWNLSQPWKHILRSKRCSG